MTTLSSISSIVSANQLTGLADRLQSIKDELGVLVTFTTEWQSNTNVILSKTGTISNAPQGNITPRTSYQSSTGIVVVSSMLPEGSGSETLTNASYTVDSCHNIVDGILNKFVTAIDEVATELPTVTTALSMPTVGTTVVDYLTSAKSIINSAAYSTTGASLIPAHAKLRYAISNLQIAKPHDNLDVLVGALGDQLLQTISSNVSAISTNVNRIANDIHSFVNDSSSGLMAISSNIAAVNNDVHQIATDIRSLTIRGSSQNQGIVVTRGGDAAATNQAAATVALKSTGSIAAVKAEKANPTSI